MASFMSHEYAQPEEAPLQSLGQFWLVGDRVPSLTPGSLLCGIVDSIEVSQETYETYHVTLVVNPDGDMISARIFGYFNLLHQNQLFQIEIGEGDEYSVVAPSRMVLFTAIGDPNGANNAPYHGVAETIESNTQLLNEIDRIPGLPENTWLYDFDDSSPYVEDTESQVATEATETFSPSTGASDNSQPIVNNGVSFPLPILPTIEESEDGQTQEAIDKKYKPCNIPEQYRVQDSRENRAPRYHVYPNFTLKAARYGCTDPACGCSHEMWPLFGQVDIPACTTACEVCGTVRGDFRKSASNLRRHVRTEHMIRNGVRDEAAGRIYTEVLEDKIVRNRKEKAKEEEDREGDGDGDDQ